MKKYIILLLATTFLLGTSVSSCTNFLEEKPESEFDEGTFYKTVESLKVGAVGAFSTLRYMYNVGTNTPLFVGMVGTDECMYPNETNLRGFIDRYTYTPTDGCIKQFWFRYYRLITACNTVIYKAQGIEGDAKLINRYVANVRFLRAWGYFNLVQTFGAVPLMTDHVTELTYDMGRTPVAEVYQLIEDDLLYMIANFSNGDARVAINTLEIVVLNGNIDKDKIFITNETVEQCINQKSLLYDKNGEEHYNIISALHKSMRNSDVDASIYWLARMLEAGEDPLYVARRLIRFASEDIGMADSRALEIATAAYQACHYIGMPECNVNLTHCVTYLALAPKSNALYMAYEKAKKDALNTVADPVPLHLCNAPTRLMKELNYGKGYQYAHDYEDKITNMQCLPDRLKEQRYYFPTNQGTEAKVIKRLEQIAYLKKRYHK